MIRVKAKLKKTGEKFNIDIIRTNKAIPTSITINVKDLEMKTSFIRYEDGRPKVWNNDGTPKYIRIEYLNQFNKYWDLISVDVDSFDKLDPNKKERYEMIYQSFKTTIRDQKLIELGIIY